MEEENYLIRLRFERNATHNDAAACFRYHLCYQVFDAARHFFTIKFDRYIFHRATGRSRRQDETRLYEVDRSMSRGIPSHDVSPYSV